jgi:hypothetical protein
MIISDSGGTTFEQPPIGAHIARCIRLIDIGTQKGEYQGQPTYKRQVVIAWELPGELMTAGDHAGKPFTVSKFYTASLHEKSGLRKDLAAWRTRDFTEEELKGFDVKALLGKPCMISLILSEKGKAKINAVMALPKGTAVPNQMNPTLNFSLDDFNEATFNSLSDGYKKLIMQSPEYHQIKNPHPAEEQGKPAAAGSGFDDMDDDIPFVSASPMFDMVPRKLRRMARYDY